MKLNDPFGRMEKRNQIAYEAIRDSMRRGGIDTPQAAREVISRTRKRAMTFLAVGIGNFSAADPAGAKSDTRSDWPAAPDVIWVITWTIKGKRYIERYIKEDLQEEKQNRGYHLNNSLQSENPGENPVTLLVVLPSAGHTISQKST